MTTAFLLDYEVEAHCCLVEGMDQIKCSHPSGDYTVYISNLHTERGVDRPLLSMQIVIQAADIKAAKDDGRRAMMQFIDMLSFVTNLKFEIHKLLRIIDWTPGKKERQSLVYQTFPGHDLPVPALSVGHAQSVELLEKAEIPDQLRRALRWFARGIRSRYPDDQFQYFWFVLELLAQLGKPTEKVNDLCSKCKSPLYCEKCADHPTHRPYPKQAILSLFKRIISDEPDAFFEKANKFRNCMMHGDDLKVVEAALGVEFNGVVDDLGKVAWHAIYRAISGAFNGSPPQGPFAALVTNVYVHRYLSVAADLIVYGEADHAFLKSFAQPEISMVYEKKDKKQPDDNP